MKELTKLQKQVLNLFKKSSLKNKFYWTGETLLSVVYLHHRQSRDLDFFSDSPISYEEIIKFIEELKKKLCLVKILERKIHNRREFFLSNQEELRIEFVHYDFPALKKRKKWKGILIDSLDDIAANKLMAFFDRNDPKDLIDLYFLLTKKNYKIEKILKLVKKKFGVEFSKSNVLSEIHKILDDLEDLKPLLLVKNSKEAERIIKNIKNYFISQSSSFLSRLLK
jgi:predicted nucleotidyltransferase component of viral defense system